MSRLIAAAGSRPQVAGSEADPQGQRVRAGAGLQRDGKGCLDFEHIDGRDRTSEARVMGLPPYDGKFHLLRDENGHPHSGRWDGKQFVYSNGERIVREITHFAARTDAAAALPDPVGEPA